MQPLIPALCLAVAALSLFFLCLIWQTGGIDTILKLSLFGASILLFLDAATGTHSAAPFVVALLFQGIGIFFLNKMWPKMAVGVAAFITLFGMLVLKGAAHF